MGILSVWQKLESPYGKNFLVIEQHNTLYFGRWRRGSPRVGSKWSANSSLTSDHTEFTIIKQKPIEWKTASKWWHCTTVYITERPKNKLHSLRCGVSTVLLLIAIPGLEPSIIT